MFRITRAHSVQHISFPFPVLRDLDEEPAPAEAVSADAPAPVSERKDAAAADASTDGG